MSTRLYINTRASSLDRALVQSESDLSPISTVDLVVGDTRPVELFFVNGIGGFETWSGNAAYAPTLAVGDCGSPTGGTFTLTFGANTTAALAWNITPAALKTVLEGLAGIGAGNISVSGVAGEYYVVEFIGTLAATDVAEFTGDPDELTPEATIEIATIRAGGVGVNERQMISLGRNPLAYSDVWTPIPNGWSGVLDLATFAMVARFSEGSSGGTLASRLQIAVTDTLNRRATYARVNANVRCTIINPESFAGASKPTLVTAAEMEAAIAAGGGNALTLVANSTGNSTLTITPPNTTAIVTVTGAAGTRVLALPTAAMTAGTHLRMRVNLPATEGIAVEVRNAAAGGTLLYSLTSETEAVAYALELYFDGTAWKPFSNVGPVV